MKNKLKTMDYNGTTVYVHADFDDIFIVSKFKEHKGKFSINKNIHLTEKK
jgi:hypothetical protein